MLDVVRPYPWTPRAGRPVRGGAIGRPGGVFQWSRRTRKKARTGCRGSALSHTYVAAWLSLHYVLIVPITPRHGGAVWPDQPDMPPGGSVRWEAGLWFPRGMSSRWLALSEVF